ncbi:MAG TPA: DNA-deoxyinosine glycosylase [Casimicrobiaceae bacterium]|nr:DNA-deoxyinosine glycosylase [Casimicrobiaceae bacterium]
MVTEDARVLILGSFPSAASLAAGQYYAHPRNHFWRLLGEVLGETLAEASYEERLRRIAAHRIALFDTIVGCARNGSLDADIREPELARVDLIAQKAPMLQLIAFNGARAARASPSWSSRGYVTLALPSSSAANTLAYASKLACWRALSGWIAER